MAIYSGSLPFPAKGKTLTTFQRKTLRQMSPLAREIALAINDYDTATRRLKRLMRHVSETELDAQALRYKFPELAINERKARERKGRLAHNVGHHSLTELDAPFHDPIPLERQLLGGQENVIS